MERDVLKRSVVLWPCPVGFSVLGLSWFYKWKKPPTHRHEESDLKVRIAFGTSGRPRVHTQPRADSKTGLQKGPSQRP